MKYFNTKLLKQNNEKLLKQNNTIDVGSTE